MKLTKHPPALKEGRCCWVCGKPGSPRLGGCWGATSALRQAGYDMGKDEMGYAHSPCLRKALARAAEKAKTTTETLGAQPRTPSDQK